jgi:hypothetical protein
MNVTGTMELSGNATVAPIDWVWHPYRAACRKTGTKV